MLELVHQLFENEERTVEGVGREHSPCGGAPFSLAVRESRCFSLASEWVDVRLGCAGDLAGHGDVAVPGEADRVALPAPDVPLRELVGDLVRVRAGVAAGVHTQLAGQADLGLQAVQGERGVDRVSLEPQPLTPRDLGGDAAVDRGADVAGAAGRGEREGDDEQGAEGERADGVAEGARVHGVRLQAHGKWVEVVRELPSVLFYTKRRCGSTRVYNLLL